MPRKAKEKIEELNTEKEIVKKPVVKKKATTTAKKSSKTTKASTSKKMSETSSATAKKKTTKSTKSTSKKSTSISSKKETSSDKEKEVKAVKKATTKSKTTKAKATKTTKASKTTTSSKKGTKSSAKSNSKSSTKSATKKTSTRKTKKTIPLTVVEYYDLPFRYNETVVKILAQTPNTLFIYWDISDDDRNQYIKTYGDDFFNTTKPVLLITNQTKNYTFEIEINDFANSWYLHVNDANCDYKIELGRRPIPHYSNISTDYIYISTSNKIELPNDHILFDLLGKTVFFRNVKTNIIEEKSIASLSCLQRIGKIYNIYDLYKEIYKEELNEDILGVNLSSSSSSTFK